MLVAGRTDVEKRWQKEWITCVSPKGRLVEAQTLPAACHTERWKIESEAPASALFEPVAVSAVGAVMCASAAGSCRR